MKDFWNKRYSEQNYAYGSQPNLFFKQSVDKLTKGSLLLPAEGEGRNAVYAAKKGWEVTAFDFSPAAKQKAEGLSKNQNTSISYYVNDVMEFSSEIQFDTIALIYAHFPLPVRPQAHKRLIQFLKPKGIVIFEAFAKEQLGKPSGGPKQLDMLFSIAEIKEEFPNLEFLFLNQELVDLKEGHYHKGPASIIRFVGRLN